MDSYEIIPDHMVRAKWICTACGEYWTVRPDYYEQSGTPVCIHCDLDMTYCHTEIRKGD